MYLSLGQLIFLIVKQQFMGVEIKQMIIYSLFGIVVTGIFMYIYTLISHKKITIAKRIFILFFMVYLCFMYMITIEIREPGSINEIHLMLDFGDFRGDYLQIQQAVYCLLNFVFFVPLGIILAVLNKNKNFLGRVAFVFMQSFLVSIIIEVFQLITKRGYFETTDIVINTAGGFVGGVFAAIVIVVFKLIRREQ